MTFNLKSKITKYWLPITSTTFIEIIFLITQAYPYFWQTRYNNTSLDKNEEIIIFIYDSSLTNPVSPPERTSMAIDIQSLAKLHLPSS